MRRGDLKARVPVVEADEVGLLGEAFNQMTTSLETQASDLREATLQEIRLRGELETILQSMTDGLIAVDLAGRVVTINREAERITGVGADWARNQKVERVLAVVDSSGQNVDLPVYRMAGGSAAGFIAAAIWEALGRGVHPEAEPGLVASGAQDPRGVVEERRVVQDAGDQGLPGVDGEGLSLWRSI